MRRCAQNDRWLLGVSAGGGCLLLTVTRQRQQRNVLVNSTPVFCKRSLAKGLKAGIGGMNLAVEFFTSESARSGGGVTCPGGVLKMLRLVSFATVKWQSDLSSLSRQLVRLQKMLKLRDGLVEMLRGGVALDLLVQNVHGLLCGPSLSRGQCRRGSWRGG